MSVCVCVRARAFVATAQTELTRSRTPGHDSQDNLSKSEGESVSSDAHDAPGAATGKDVTSAPGVATTTPSAAPAAAPIAAAAPEPTIENPVKGAENLPEAPSEKLPEFGEVAHRDSLQEAVDKAQASKTGVISSLDGGDKEGAGMFEFSSKIKSCQQMN